MVESPIYKTAAHCNHGSVIYLSQSSPAISDGCREVMIRSNSLGCLYFSDRELVSGPEPHGELAGVGFLRRLDVPLGNKIRCYRCRGPISPAAVVCT